MSETSLLPPFDYFDLDETTRVLVQKKTDETHGLMKRTTEYIIQIGQNLLEVQQHLPEMKFSAWLRAEFDFSRQTAYNFMKVATKFGGSCKTVLQLPAKVLYELASSSDAIIEHVETGQLLPTLEAIKAAKEAERRAKEGEQQARSQAQAAQQQLVSLQESAQEQQATIEQLLHELETLQTRFSVLNTPEVQVKEVEKRVTPPEITVELADLQQKVSTLTQQREILSRQVAQLQEEARAEVLEHHEGEYARRVRLNWFQVTNEYHRCVVKLLGQWPTSLDAQAFEADDWTRLSQTKELTQRLLAECVAITKGMIIEVTPSAPQGRSDSLPAHNEIEVSAAEELIQPCDGDNPDREQQREAKMSRAYLELEEEGKPISSRTLAARAHVRRAFCSQWLATHHSGPGSTPPV